VSESLDRDARLAVYHSFVECGAPPTVAETAAALDVSVQDATEVYRRLEAAHEIVLAPGTLNVWLANPFSAVPTAFRVRGTRGEWWGSCIWDALGIPAMLGESAAIATTCADCGDQFELRVSGDALEPVDGVAHFAVPARSWWENIGYT
jgi:hypothetical protein